jgi:hypothetical protein
MNRLVLLVPRGAGEVGFEIRSLQEFMAARMLTSNTTDEIVLARLAATAPATHWRNTWLLAAGRVAAEREHLWPGLITIVSEMDTAGWPELFTLPGAELALDMVDDGLAAGLPRFQRLLVKQALGRLAESPSRTMPMAMTLRPVVVGDGETRALAEHALEQSLVRTDVGKICAIQMLAAWSLESDPLAAWARARLHAALDAADAGTRAAVAAIRGFRSTRDPIKQYQLPVTGARPIRLATLLKPHLNDSDLDQDASTTLGRFLRAVQGVKLEQASAGSLEIVPATASPPLGDEQVGYAFSNAAVTERIVHAAQALPLPRWAVRELLCTYLGHYLDRRPVKEEDLLLPAGDSPDRAG